MTPECIVSRHDVEHGPSEVLLLMVGSHIVLLVVLICESPLRMTVAERKAGTEEVLVGDERWTSEQSL